MKMFFKKYRRYIIYIVLFLALLYLIIWLLFTIDGILPLGKGLDKSDWLSFVGNFLGFSGAFLLGVVVFYYTFKSDREKLLDQGKIVVSLDKDFAIQVLTSLLPIEYDVVRNNDSISILRDGNTRIGFLVLITFGLRCCNMVYPEYVRVESLNMDLFKGNSNMKKIDMKNSHEKYFNIKPGEGIFQFMVHPLIDINILDDEQALEEANRIVFEMELLAKRGKVITPIYCKYIADFERKQNEVRCFTVVDGFTNCKKAYLV